MPGTYYSPVETVLTDFAAWLLAGIAAYLTGITTAMADSIALDTPVKFQVSDADPWGQTRYPVGLIYPTEVVVESDADSGHDELQIGAELMIAISDGSPDRGTKRILRTVEAVREMIRDSRSMGGKVDMITTRNIAYFPADPDSPAIRVATIATQIRKMVSRY